MDTDHEHNHTSYYHTHKGIPVRTYLNEAVGWSNLAPNAGNVDATSTLHEIGDRSFSGQVNHDEYFLCTLWNVGQINKKKLLKQGEELYNKVHGDCGEDWDELSREDKEEFIDEVYLSTEGVDAYDSLGEYTMDLLDRVEVKYFHREFSENMKCDQHSIICFPNDGKKITAKNIEIISTQLDNVEDWLNGNCICLETPFSAVPEAFLSNGYGNDNADVKQIEKIIDKKLSAKTGTRWVKVPFATGNDEGTLDFDENKIIAIPAKNQKEAEQIAAFWDEWGNAKIEKRTNQKTR